MKNSELDQLLKASPAPEPTADYWAQFPKRVMAKAQWRRDCPETPRRQFNLSNRGPLFALGLAVVCVVFGFVLGFFNGRQSAPEIQLASAAKYYREIHALFPNQVKAIVFDKAGAHLELARDATVPSSPPLFITISGPGESQRIVTFSGQQVQIGGDVCDVLVDHGGCVLVVGRNLIWSSSRQASKTGAYRIEAKLLEKAS